jgi:SPP1 gp7 family putative phage head morphogenesis protein
MDGEKARDRYFARVEKEYEREVAKIWRDSLSQIRAEMGSIYEKYAQNGLLTRAEMTRYNRLTTLEKNMQAIVKDATKESVKIIKRLKPEEYGEAFFRTAKAFDDAATVALSWGPLDKAAVAASLENPFLEEAVKKALFVGASNVRTAINNGLALGQSYTDMMKDLKGMVNKENFEIMRILRTELHDAQEAGTAASYEEAIEHGIEGKVIWLATLDDRTRESHADMDGEEQNEDGMFILRGKNGTYECPYPGYEGLPAEERINCRCTTAFQLTGYTPGG